MSGWSLPLGLKGPEQPPWGPPPLPSACGLCPCLSNAAGAPVCSSITAIATWPWPSSAACIPWACLITMDRLSQSSLSCDWSWLLSPHLNLIHWLMLLAWHWICLLTIISSDDLGLCFIWLSSLSLLHSPSLGWWGRAAAGGAPGRSTTLHSMSLWEQPALAVSWQRVTWLTSQPPL